MNIFAKKLPIGTKVAINGHTAARDVNQGCRFEFAKYPQRQGKKSTEYPQKFLFIHKIIHKDKIQSYLKKILKNSIN